MDKSKHEAECPYLKPYTSALDDDTKPRPKTKQWFEYMGYKNNCNYCGVELEFTNE